MDTSHKIVDFYMGANSPNGFFSFYQEIEHPREGYRSFLIKGGAGTGKSRLMKKICNDCGSDESLIEQIHCSSDINSLDGLLLTDKKVSILDATPPHVIEPSYPGGYQTVINLCEYFDEQKLTSRLNKTVELQTRNNNCHKKCCSLLNCANILLRDNYHYIAAHTDFKKISALASRIIKKEFKGIASSNSIEHKRLLSAVTNQGVKTFTDTPTTLASRIYLVKDEYGVSSNALFSILRQAALEKGYEIYSCYCPLNPTTKLEHLFIPQLDLGFVSSNKYSDFSHIKPYGVISYARFSDSTAIRQKKQYLSFNKKASLELILAAADVLKEAKIIHDDLEKQYTDSVDFEKVNQKTAEVIEKINKRRSVVF